MRKVIYTAIFSNYDTLKEPLQVTNGWEYICFTDQKLKSDVWDIVKVNPSADSVRAARKIKIMPETVLEFDECIWMDASFLIKGNADEFVSKARVDMMLFKHPERNSLHAEAKACIDRKKDSEFVIKKQMDEYRSCEVLFSDLHISLPATGIIYRRNTWQNEKFGAMWWAQVANYSRRDQLSFGYAAVKTGTAFQILHENIRDKNNEFFELKKHN